MYAKKEEIYPPYVSKYNSNREKPVILLMIINGEKWHYLVVIKISALLRERTSKHHGDFYCRIKEYVKINIFVTLSWLLKTLKH